MKILLDRLVEAKCLRLVTLFVVVVSVMAIMGIGKLSMVSDYRIFFDKDNPEVVAYERIQAQYQSSENVLLVVVPPQGETALSEDGLAMQLWLTERAWEMPFVTRVDSVPNFPRTRVDGDDLFIEELFKGEDELSPAFIAELRAYVTTEIQLRNLLVDEQGKYAALNLTLRLPGKDPKAETLVAAQSVASLVGEATSKWPEFKIYSSGMVMLNNAFFEAARKDFSTLIPIMLVGVVFVAGLLLRSWLAILSLMSVMILSIGAALGGSAWLGLSLSAPTVSVPIILASVIVASGVHLIAAIQHQTGTAIERTVAAVRNTFVPITLTNLTTIVGFLSMNMSESPPFRDLGNMVALGVLFSWLLSLTLTPYLHMHFAGSKSEDARSVQSSLMEALRRIISCHYRKVVLIGVPFAALASGFAFTNVSNDDFVAYFDESVPFRSQTDFINDNLTGIYSLEFSIETGVSNGALDPEVLRNIEQFSYWLRQQQEVSGVVSIADVLKEISQNMNRGEESYYRIPETTAEAAQYFLIYEMGLPAGKSVNDRLSMSKSSARVTARLTNLDSIEMSEFERRAVRYWATISTSPQVIMTYSSPTLMFSHIGHKNTRNLIGGAVTALLLISLLLSIVFRSVFVGLLSLVANLLPLSIAFGLWGLASGEISMGLAGVSSMVIGIVVDDTIHFLHHLRNFWTQHSFHNAVMLALKTVGPAMLISSIVLIIGFLTLTLSTFEKNASMGLLTAITIWFALLVDLMLLPAFLLWLIGFSFLRQPSPEPIKGVA